MSVEKLEEEDIRRAKFARENAGCEKRTRDKRPAEEISSAVWPLLCTHVFCCCYGSNNCACFRLMSLLGYTCPWQLCWMHLPGWTCLWQVCIAKLLLSHTIATNIGWKRKKSMPEKTIKTLNRESKHSMYKSTNSQKMRFRVKTFDHEPRKYYTTHSKCAFC